MKRLRVYNKRGGAPPDAVYVGRGSQWGNPFRIGIDGDRDACIEKFKYHTLPTLDVRPLVGKSLVCFCAPRACHGDLLLNAAEELA